MTSLPDRVPLTDDARSAWERALALWRVWLDDPTVRPGAADAHGAPAWFSFPPSVTVDPRYLADRGLADELWSMFAHEIGHHVLAPSTRIDSLKIDHQMARAITAATARVKAGEGARRLSNLWCDLLVNTRVAQLQRAEKEGGATATRDLGIVRLGLALYPAPEGSGDRLWWVYCRAYELLWQLPAGTLCPLEPPPRPERARVQTTLVPLSQIPEKHREKERLLRAAQTERERVAAELAGATATNPAVDAALVADAVRSFATDPVSGAALFGVIAAPYLAEQAGAAEIGAGEPLAGCGVDDAPATADELGRILADQRLRDDLPRHPGMVRAPDGQGDPEDTTDEGAKKDGQRLTIARTLALYRESGEDAVLAAWYRNEAAAWVRPYTRQAPSTPTGGIPGPVELWEVGDALADLDWPLTLRSGTVIPGVTTRRRSELDDEPIVRETSLELDLYIDSSGSMTHPRNGSPAVLAGTILALSILRGGGRVRVTSFSGTGEVAGMPRFGRDPAEIIAAISLFFGRSTSFPLDLYAARYAGLPPAGDDDQRHVVVLSDDGLVSMFGVGNEPYQGVARTVREVLTTGTLVLMDRRHQVAQLAERDGYDVVYLQTMADAPAACAALAEALHG
ncbi:VWA domain-containing protein [Microbacterium sp. Leaf320]|uniref:VWA domain-containing protein n=1 Tax=Microbacterium sp. Leaf320 TaxID=1736334 RepID=UPI000700ABDB|nr:VWA domain-containing protein [Microbacterium sp. Leaf320]KQQ66045.1 NAD/NADP transhydrogenase subunit alpha [Microbacterium sp. Leaf320]